MSKPVIKIGNVSVPANLTQKELLKFLKDNKDLLITEKKSEIKKADAITVPSEFSKNYCIDTEGKLVKAAVGGETDKAPNTEETVLVVINTTNWMDSHKDVHIPGIWKKSLKDQKGVMLHLQEHDMSFAAVISDESKGYTEKIAWKELGMDISGVTEALVFSTPLKGRNPYMEDQYRKGFVKNHSVGMQYVIIKLCINEPDEEYYKEEYANWTQYSPMVANLEEAEANGYFWAILEAKVVEGSAVVKGSNIITPTLGFKSSVQPEKSTETSQPAESTGGKEENNAKEIRWEKIASAISL